MGRIKMQILHNQRPTCYTCVWMIRKQEVINKRVSDDIVLDLGDGDRVIGIEITDASRNLNLDRLLPVTYEASPEVGRG